MRWRIYYDDGSSFSDADGTLAAAPAWGVQAIVCEPDVWHAGDFAGLIDFLARRGLVKFGRLTSNESYRRALQRAQGDPDFDPQTRHVYERGDFYWYEGD
jgi:hypothetical protein